MKTKKLSNGKWQVIVNGIDRIFEVNSFDETFEVLKYLGGIA